MKRLVIIISALFLLISCDGKRKKTVIIDLDKDHLEKKTEYSSSKRWW